MDIRLIDPFSFGFFADESLELAERVGMALREGAKYMPISFGKSILPMALSDSGRRSLGVLPDSGGCSVFSYVFGLIFKHDIIDELVQKHPEHAQTLREYEMKFRPFTEAVSLPLTEKQRSLSSASAARGGGWGGHANPDFGMIVNLGTEGMRRKIAENAEKHPEADWFYRACSYAVDALDILGGRFRELAEKLAQECTDPEDKHRYELAAQAFSVVPQKPAYDFTSACMAFWMLFTFDGIDSPGRFDQYMFRAYNLEQNRADAHDMLSRLWDCFHDTRTWNLCLSGSDENWNDMSNRLTYDILTMAAEKKYQTPNITLRVHRNTPDALWSAIHTALAAGIGMPALYNDEILCPALEKIGIPVCDSHLYCMNGCNQIDIMGKSHMGLEDGEINLAKALEYALHNGVNAQNGQMESIPTGDAHTFKSYQQLELAFFAQMDYLTHMSCMQANMAQQMRAFYQPNPLRSCLIEGCLEKGADYRNGGPLYGHGQILLEGIADAGDSLWAIKKLVFIEKKYTMNQLIDALDADFEGYGELLHDFSTCEKFGNDIAPVDEITTGAVNRFFEKLKRIHTYRGGVYTGGCSTFTNAPNCGRKVAALPNGHRNGDPLLADCIGATPGRDVNGPTALIKSVLGYNHIDSGSGFVFQVKYDKSFFTTPKGKATFIAMAKTYFKNGGQQYTASVVSPQDLLDAKEHPENHRDLIVRVGGYSDYFVNLEEGLQDSVIARSFMKAE